ncbi:hypothetical protein [Sphingomonas sp.]
MAMMMSSRYDNRFVKVKSELNLVKWVAGFNLALTAAVLAKLLI